MVGGFVGVLHWEYTMYVSLIFKQTENHQGVRRYGFHTVRYEVFWKSDPPLTLHTIGRDVLQTLAGARQHGLGKSKGR